MDPGTDRAAGRRQSRRRHGVAAREPVRRHHPVQRRGQLRRLDPSLLPLPSFRRAHCADLGVDGLRNAGGRRHETIDRKSTRLNSSHVAISYAVFCLKKKKKKKYTKKNKKKKKKKRKD